MVTNSPYSITVELEAPHRNFEAVHEGNYNTIGGYKLMMRTAEDVADDEDPIHVATLRPSEDFTFRSPCAASHPRTRTYTVEGLQPGSSYDFAVVALCCDPAGADSELSVSSRQTLLRLPSAWSSRTFSRNSVPRTPFGHGESSGLRPQHSPPSQP